MLGLESQSASLALPLPWQESLWQYVYFAS